MASRPQAEELTDCADTQRARPAEQNSSAQARAREFNDLRKRTQAAIGNKDWLNAEELASELVGSFSSEIVAAMTLGDVYLAWLKDIKAEMSNYMTDDEFQQCAANGGYTYRNAFLSGCKANLPEPIKKIAAVAAIKASTCYAISGDAINAEKFVREVLDSPLASSLSEEQRELLNTQLKAAKDLSVFRKGGAKANGKAPADEDADGDVIRAFGMPATPAAHQGGGLGEDNESTYTNWEYDRILAAAVEARNSGNFVVAVNKARLLTRTCPLYPGGYLILGNFARDYTITLKQSYKNYHGQFTKRGKVPANIHEYYLIATEAYANATLKATALPCSKEFMTKGLAAAVKGACLAADFGRPEKVEELQIYTERLLETTPNERVRDALNSQLARSKKVVEAAGKMPDPPEQPSTQAQCTIQ